MNPLKTIWDACVDPQDNVQDIVELLGQGHSVEISGFFCHPDLREINIGES